MPAPSQDNRRVIAYLTERGISRKVLEACFRAGILYESADYHNAVFVGKDETGTARYAFLRGTYPKGKPFKAEVSGSDKQYCFCIPPKDKSRRAAVYEGAVDALAHLTLEQTADKYITNVAAGCGLIRCAGNIVPFENSFPRDTRLYRLMTTKPDEALRGMH